MAHLRVYEGLRTPITHRPGVSFDLVRVPGGRLPESESVSTPFRFRINYRGFGQTHGRGQIVRDENDPFVLDVHRIAPDEVLEAMGLIRLAPNIWLLAEQFLRDLVLLADAGRHSLIDELAPQYIEAAENNVVHSSRAIGAGLIWEQRDIPLARLIVRALDYASALYNQWHGASPSTQRTTALQEVSRIRFGVGRGLAGPTLDTTWVAEGPFFRREGDALFIGDRLLWQAS